MESIPGSSSDVNAFPVSLLLHAAQSCTALCLPCRGLSVIAVGAPSPYPNSGAQVGDDSWDFFPVHPLLSGRAGGA